MYSYTAEALVHCRMALGSLGFADPPRGWGQAVDEVYGVYFYIIGTDHSQWERPTHALGDNEGETNSQWEVPCEVADGDLPKASRTNRWRRRVAPREGESHQEM